MGVWVFCAIDMAHGNLPVFPNVGVFRKAARGDPGLAQGFSDADVDHQICPGPDRAALRIGIHSVTDDVMPKGGLLHRLGGRDAVAGVDGAVGGK